MNANGLAVESVAIVTGPGHHAPAVAARGAEQAREWLARRKPGPYRPTEGDQP